MKVKCVASIAPILFSEDRETVVQSLPVMKDLREALLLGEWSIATSHVTHIHGRHSFFSLLIFSPEVYDLSIVIH